MAKPALIFSLLYCFIRSINGQGQGQQAPSYTPIEKGWSVWKAMIGQPQTSTNLFNEWQGRDQPLAGSNFVSLPYVAGNSNGETQKYRFSNLGQRKQCMNMHEHDKRPVMVHIYLKFANQVLVRFQLTLNSSLLSPHRGKSYRDHNEGIIIVFSNQLPVTYMNSSLNHH